MTTVTNVAMMEFFRRFQDLQHQRIQDDKLIEDILLHWKSLEDDLRTENGRLTAELEETQLDLEDSKRSRRDLQMQLNKLTQKMGQFTSETDQMRNRNPYVMVLVDGDGMIFNEDLIQQGIEGGKTAATILRNAVLEQCGELAGEIEVIAKVCGNITGLSKAMQRDGSLENADDLRNFTLGFTQGKASFDFVDVGHGKERADSKIKECMRWHLRNYNCKQILLGISHDAGYAPFLDEVLNQDDFSRITILEGPPTVRELRNTNLQILNFNTIFRAEKLTNRSVPSANQNNTWAGVTSILPPPGSASPVQAKATPTQTTAKLAWTAGMRGIDPAIAVNQVVLEKVKKRSVKLCNNHYLRGPCAKGDECIYEHDYKPTPDEYRAISWLSRLNPCTNKQYCDQELCIYGHHCPAFSYPEKNNKDREPVCVTFGCRFGADAHPPGTKIKNPRKEYDY